MKLCVTLDLVRVGRLIPAATFMSLLGLMASAFVVVPLGLLHMRSIQRWFGKLRLDPVRDRSRRLLVPASLERDLEFWRAPATMTQGVNHRALWFMELRPLAAVPPWRIPAWSDALSQDNGRLTSLPVLGFPLWAWLLRG